MNLKEIVENVRAELTPATNIDNLVKRWANKAQSAFLTYASHLGKKNFSWLEMNLSFVTTANINEYSLSPLVDVGKVITIREEITPRSIDVISKQRFLELVPNPRDTTGTPEYAYLNGFSSVENQPSSASQITVVSTAADTAVIKLEGLSSTGVLIDEEVTLNGVNPVTSTLSYSRILSRSVNGFLNGTVTMTSNGGLVTNSVIGRRQRQSFFPRIVFYPMPSAAITYYYDFSFILPPLVNDNDFSLIPDKYHDAIEYFCVYRGSRHKKDPSAWQESKQAFMDKVQEAVNDDKGIRSPLVMESWSRSSRLGDGTLPGRFPRDY